MSLMRLLLLGSSCFMLMGIATRPSDPVSSNFAVLQPANLTQTWTLQHSKPEDDNTSMQPSVLVEEHSDAHAKTSNPILPGTTYDNTDSTSPNLANVVSNNTAGKYQPAGVVLSLDHRPNEGKQADIVQFGIVFKQLYSVSLKDDTYQADLVFIFRWHDERVKKLPFKGDRLTMSGDFAKQIVWLPKMFVSNRALQGVDVLSSTVTAQNDGNVMKVERVLAVLKNKFDVTDYPFDTQTFEVTLSSTTYMASDLGLQSIGVCGSSDDVGCTKVEDGALDEKGFIMKDVKTDTFDDINGLLQKSRGSMLVTVERNSKKFYDSVLFPGIFLAICSYTVFVMPLSAPFVMPRVATGMICYLAIFSLGQKYENMIGSQASASCGDAYMKWLCEMMCATVMINVALEFLAHGFLQDVESAKQINNEMRVLYPALFIFTYIQISHGYRDSYVSFTMLAYTVFSLLRLTQKNGDVAAQNKASPMAETSPASPASSTEAAAVPADGKASEVKYN